MSDNKYKDLITELLNKYKFLMGLHFQDIDGSNFAEEWSDFFIAWKRRTTQTLEEEKTIDN